MKVELEDLYLEIRHNTNVLICLFELLYAQASPSLRREQKDQILVALKIMNEHRDEVDERNGREIIPIRWRHP